MDKFTALMKADEVKTFPTLEMPAPKIHMNPGRLRKAGNDEKTLFPGLLKTKKSTIVGNRSRKGEDYSVLTGFNSINLKFDVTNETTDPYQHLKQNNNNSNNNNTNNNRDSIAGRQPESAFQVNSTQILLSSPTANSHQANQTKSDPTVDELRNYVVMMDKYSLHNFMIYDGKTLKETPEFQSFRRTYQHKWGSISSIIQQIESFLSNYQVKLAIINGPKVFELSKLNLPAIKKEDIYSCLDNLEQLKTYFDGEGGSVTNDTFKAAIKIQCQFRARIARKRVKRLKIVLRSVIRIQSFGRLLIQRSVLSSKLQQYLTNSDRNWLSNRSILSHWWSAALGNVGSESVRDPMRSRTLIVLPSLSIAEYLRLNYENFSGLQNTLVSVLYQLADPAVTLIYVCPKHLTSNEIVYHEKLLSLMGISLLPKRLYFITPELIEKLPSHLPLSLALLCSSLALNKIKHIIKRNRSMPIIVPTTVSWIEKRIAYALNVPVLSADPAVSESLSSRSFAKKVFEEAEVNVPIGAHDIFNVDDLVLALSKLMAANIAIRRWILKLNYDHNQESCAIFDADKLNIVNVLRKEQSDMDSNGWFSRQVQLNVRKRLLAYLTKEFGSRIKICRRDIYSDWDYYVRVMKQYGAVLEAEPIETIGFVNCLCFIDPVGNIELSAGVEVYVDHNFQGQGYHFPQRMTPTLALEGASRAVAQVLASKYGVIGYVTIQYQSYWDALDHLPRLWGIGLHFGMSEVFGAVGTVATMDSAQFSALKTQTLKLAEEEAKQKARLPFSLIATVPEGRFVTYVPFSVHSPLRSSNDETFFKLTRMRGIAFDLANKQGTIFFVVDSIVGGAVSMICVANTRKKATAQMINALTFISQQFGKDHESDQRRWDNLSTILTNMKKILRFDKNI